MLRSAGIGLLSACAVFLVGSCGGSDDADDSAVIAGGIDKGPFVLGSSVSVAILDNATPTGTVFLGQTATELGEFAVQVKAGEGDGVLIEAVGFYYNELTGGVSGSNLTLRAVYVVGSSSAGGEQDGDTRVNCPDPAPFECDHDADGGTGTTLERAHVNLITHLTHQRVLTLVEQGSSYALAIEQAEQELIAALPIGAGEQLVLGGTDVHLFKTASIGSAYLLALGSTVLAAAREREGGEGTVQEVLNLVVADLADDGQLVTALADELKQGMTFFNGDLVMRQLKVRLDALGSAAEVPDIHLALDSDADGHVNASDNCRYEANFAQADSDSNGVGDVCENRFTKIARNTHEHKCGLLAEDGTVVCWHRRLGEPSPFQPFAEPEDLMYPLEEQEILAAPTGAFLDISQSGDSPGFCGVRSSDNAIECWGEVFTVPPAGSYRAISEECAIRNDGLVCWHESSPDPLLLPGSFSKLAMDRNEKIVCATADDGALSCWQRMDIQPPPPEGLPFSFEPLAVPSGSFDSLALGFGLGCGVTGGSPACWNLRTLEIAPPPPTGTYQDVLAVTSYSVCGARVDETAICWDIASQGDLSALSPPSVPLVSMTRTHTAGACGLDASGYIHCMGDFDMPRY